MKLLFILCISLLSIGAWEAASAQPARRGDTLRCPLIVDLSTGTYSRSPERFRCYRSTSAARRAGFKKDKPFTVVNGVRIRSILPFEQTGFGTFTTGGFEVKSAQLPVEVSIQTFALPTDLTRVVLTNMQTGAPVAYLFYGLGSLQAKAFITIPGVYTIQVYGSEQAVTSMELTSSTGS